MNSLRDAADSARAQLSRATRSADAAAAKASNTTATTNTQKSAIKQRSPATSSGGGETALAKKPLSSDDHEDDEDDDVILVSASPPGESGSNAILQVLCSALESARMTTIDTLRTLLFILRLQDQARRLLLARTLMRRMVVAVAIAATCHGLPVKPTPQLLAAHPHQTTLAQPQLQLRA